MPHSWDELGYQGIPGYSDKGGWIFLGFTWLLGNPRILRQGGNLPPMYLELLYYIYHVTWDSIVLYERVLPFLDRSGRNDYIFIARGI